MKHSEFYGVQESEQYEFYRIPKLLFTAEKFKDISFEAKFLYGLLLERTTLSQKNGWIDEEGRVYIIYKIEEIMQSIGCGNKKAGQLLVELESKANLILRKKQGLGKANLIYVKKFTVIASSAEEHILPCENDMSGNVELTSPEVSNGHGNNTDMKKTEMSNTDHILSSDLLGTERERMDSREECLEYFAEQLEYECLQERYPNDHDILEEILELIVDTTCSKRKTIRIASDDKPAQVVRSQFMKLTMEHICFVVDCMKENTTRIRNVRQYLLATIYNAPLTIGNYYSAMVRHDMSKEFWHGE